MNLNQNRLPKKHKRSKHRDKSESAPKPTRAVQSKGPNPDQEVIWFPPLTPSPHLASFTGSFSEADEDQPSIPGGKPLPLELWAALLWQPAGPLQHSYYMSPSFLSRWTEHHPHILEEHDPNTKGYIEDCSILVPF